MPEIRFPEFRDQYALTAYPFVDGATMTSTSQQRIDRELLLDASLYPIGVSGPYIYISAINIAPREVVFTFADNTRANVAYATFDPLIAADTLTVIDGKDRPAGILAVDSSRLANFTSWPVGLHTFVPAASQFVPSCVIPTPEQGVRGISIESGELFTGDVVIVGENGVVVRQDGEHTIRIDIVGDPLFRRKLCEPVNLFTAPRFLRTINGCPPDVHGNYNITVGDNITNATILRVYKNESGLVIEAVGKTI